MQRVARVIGALLALNLLLVFPYAEALSGGLSLLPRLPLDSGSFAFLRALLIRDAADLMRISAELVLLIGLAWLLRHRLGERALYRTGCVFLAALCIYLLYDAGMRLAFAKPPIFYEDLLILPDALNLIVDAWSSTIAIGLIGGVAGLAAMLWIIRTAWRVILTAVTASSDQAGNRMGVGAIAYAVALAYVLFVSGWFRVDENIDRIGARWTLPKIAGNLGESLRWHRALSGLDLADAPPYHRFALAEGLDAQAQATDDLPNVYLFMVESYGARLYEEADAADAMWQQARDLDQRLQRAGYTGYSAYSDATIRGGRSWLSIASVFSGVRIGNQAVYRLFAEQHEQLPHMGRYFRNQGYYTVGLQPTVRERPGVPRSNYYAFEQPVFHRELAGDYAGPAYGWGYYPDQYSLNFTADRYLARDARPHFLFFMGVTSHAPWDEGHLPPVLNDYRQLAQPVSAHVPTSAGDTLVYTADQPGAIVPTGTTEAPGGMGTRIWQSVRNHLAGAGAAMSAANCQRFVAYDLEVIARFMEERIPAQNRDAIVIILGDHQPGFVSGPAQDSRTPLHIFSRSANRLAPLAKSDAAFQKGFVPPPVGTPAALGHAGIYPLIAWVLGSDQPVPAAELRGLPPETLLQLRESGAAH